MPSMRQRRSCAGFVAWALAAAALGRWTVTPSISFVGSGSAPAGRLSARHASPLGEMAGANLEQLEELAKDPEKMKKLQDEVDAMMKDPAKKKALEEYSKMTQQAVAKLQDDPELQDFFEDIKKNGMEAMKKYEKDERILAKFSQATGGPEAWMKAMGGMPPGGMPGGMPGMAPSAPNYKPGDEVVIFGLAKAPELNGKKAMVVPPTAEEKKSLEGHDPSLDVEPAACRRLTQFFFATAWQSGLLASGAGQGPQPLVAARLAEGMGGGLGVEGATAEARLESMSATSASRQAPLSALLAAGSWDAAVALLRRRVEAALRASASALNACAPVAWQRAVAALRAFPELLLRADVVTSLRAVAAFTREGRWSRALGLLSSSKPFGCQANVLCAGIGAAPWASALAALAAASGAGILVDHVCVNTAVTACAAGGVWQRAVDFLRETLASNVVRFSAAVTACDVSGRWPTSLGIWESIRCRRADCDAICLNSVISSCVPRWRKPLELLASGASARIRRDVVSFSSAIGGLESAQKWGPALELLEYMAQLEVPPNRVSRNAALAAQGGGGDWRRSLRLLGNSPGEVSYRAAIDLCDKEGKGEEAAALLQEAHASGVVQSISFYPWAFGRLLVFSTDSSHDALFSALHVLRNSELRLPPQEVTTLLWSAAMLSASNPLFSKLLCEQAVGQMPAFSAEDLLLLAWGAASSAQNFELSLRIAQESTRRLNGGLAFGDTQVTLGVDPRMQIQPGV
ncbi:unnamed protein product [Symbiodinium natans]|uniref:STI1 domain-containing protein n=1 Tax=Symbiodinium natans TaxID=878477 RepID=A0A812QKS0_9DINO|nr:unnamed protein product [Symbiodinium natans]